MSKNPRLVATLLVFGLIFIASGIIEDDQNTSQVRYPTHQGENSSLNQEQAKISPNNSEVYYNKAQGKMRAGDYKGSIQDFSEAIVLNQEYIMAYNGRGTAKSLLRDYKGAIEDYNKAIKLNPNDPLAYGLRGGARIALNQIKEGCADLYKAINLGGGSLGNRTNLREQTQKYCK